MEEEQFKYHIYLSYMARKWKNLPIPEDIIEKIKILIAEPEVTDKYSFGTPSEFVRRALTDKIAEIEKEIKEKRGK